MSSDLVLVAGSTGSLGGKICDLLLLQHRRVRALVRPTSDPAKVERLRALGAEVVVGDIEQPETLNGAVAGATYVVTTASTFPVDQRPNAIDIVERGGTCNLVDAAGAAGVRRFVHVSLLEAPKTYPHQQAKLAAEAHLKASGTEYAIVKPGLFADVWFSPIMGFDVAGGTVQVYGDGTALHSWICSADVAAFVVWALDAADARNAAIELGGPDRLSQLDIVEFHEELLGTRLERRFLPAGELERMHAEGRTPLEVSLAGVMLNAARGGHVDTAALAGRSGIRLTPMREFAAGRVSAGSGT
jgi:uncharacterized protein YbjT (DUF2867 family)